ncbi:hypothetical protein HFO33_06725 [Rhizobium leguminosarum]|uniref:hypothetical protein n=1 Tax=Rhizobium leguminosarum TaxID=384 RepID=UPI001C979D25|nr:hypothetical protein [Rhizobium leguminosarum]MBY5716285.1 hypothetical protein [Rhizobium leguminosarum]
MRIFASWSGEESKRIAELLKTWIPSVIQDAEVYVSSQDIGKGERWLNSVSNNLAEIDFGIIVVTKTNVTAPWILFEAGALSKSVKGIVAPLLCGVENFEAAKSPLTQFQYVRPVADEMRDLMVQVNAFSAKPLDQTRVEVAFAKWWPDFESAYRAIELPDAKPAKKETDNTRLQNIEEALGEVMLELRRLRQQPSRLALAAAGMPSTTYHFGAEFPKQRLFEGREFAEPRLRSTKRSKVAVAEAVQSQAKNKQDE